MRARGRKPRALHGRGEVRADSLYPVQVLLRRLGIGRNTLTSLRRRGLPVHSLGRRCTLIDGGELVRFLRAQWAANGEPRKSQNPSTHPSESDDFGRTVPSHSTFLEAGSC